MSDATDQLQIQLVDQVVCHYAADEADGGEAADDESAAGVQPRVNLDPRSLCHVGQCCNDAVNRCHARTQLGGVTWRKGSAHISSHRPRGTATRTAHASTGSLANDCLARPACPQRWEQRYTTQSRTCVTSTSPAGMTPRKAGSPRRPRRSSTVTGPSSATPSSRHLAILGGRTR